MFALRTGEIGVGRMRNCVAEMEDRRRRGVEDPLAAKLGLREVISSPFAEGPAEEKDPLCDRFSVEVVPWLSLRLRLRYFSMASASLSRTLLANGES